MKTCIDKQFDFCYGHRVHNQRLNTNFTESANACLACRHLHGHQGTVKVFLEEDTNSTNLKDTGMVTDFKHLGWFKNFVDDVLDHKFIMDLQDPLIHSEFNELTDENSVFDVNNIIQMKEGYYVPDLTVIQRIIDEWSMHSGTNEASNQAIFEKYEGVVFVDFVPTSENLSAWLLTVVQQKMKDLPGVRVKAVEYWETPKSHCRVEADYEEK